MTDTSEVNEPGAEQTSAPQPEKVVSKRGRRLVIAIIIILLLALIGITALLLNLVAPQSGVAPRDETGGIEWIKSIYGWGSTPDTQFVIPQEVFIDDAGNILVTDARNEKAVYRFEPEGSLIDTQPAGAPQTEIIGFGPLAVDGDGRLFVGESTMERVRVFSAGGEDLGFFGFPNPIDIDYRDGAMVIGSTAGFAIVDPETGEPRRIIGTRGKGPEEFDTVNGVAIAENGNIYVVDAFNNRLKAFDAEGEPLWSVQTGAPGNEVDLSGGGAMAASRETTAPAALQLPGDVCVDGNGRVVVVDALDFSVAVFDPEDGEFIAKYGEYGALDGQFVYPSSIAYDEIRDWFAVADAGNSRVQIVRLPGSGRTLDPLAAARRSLSGPLRACIAPLILLLIMLVLFVVTRARKRRAERRGAGSEAPVAAPAENAASGGRN